MQLLLQSEECKFQNAKFRITGLQGILTFALCNFHFAI